EWLDYSVNVTSAGTYTAQLRVASPSGATVHLGFNTPSNVWQSIPIPATGGWQNWTTVSVQVTLGAGVQLMTVLSDTGGLNLDSVTVSGGTPPPPPPSAPEIVIYASDIAPSAIHGAWTTASDGTAAAGVTLLTPDNGVAITSAPLASPADF